METWEELIIALRQVYNLYGDKIQEKGMALSAFSDFAPKLKRERRIFEAFLSCGGHQILRSVIDLNDSEKVVVVNNLVTRMNDESAIDADQGVDFCSVYWEAIIQPGCRMTFSKSEQSVPTNEPEQKQVKKPAQQPSPASQPTPAPASHPVPTPQNPDNHPKTRRKNGSWKAVFTVLCLITLGSIFYFVGIPMLSKRAEISDSRIDYDKSDGNNAAIVESNPEIVDESIITDDYSNEDVANFEDNSNNDDIVGDADHSIVSVDQEDRKENLPDNNTMMETSEKNLTTDTFYRMNVAEDVALLTDPKSQEEGAYILSIVPAGTTAMLYVDTVDNGYGKTAYGGYTGWISMSYLESIGDSESMINTDQIERPKEYASRVWQMNQLIEEHAAISHVEDNRGQRLDEDEIYETVFGIPGWNRYSITGIYVQDSLEGIPENRVDLTTARQGGAANCAVDLSATGDGGVLGWIDGSGALRIAGIGGVKAPVDCSSLFARFTAATIIDLGGNLHTDDTTDFRYFFYSDTEAETLNVTGMVTSKATSFDKMFTGCRKVKSLDLSSFDTSSVVSFYYMLQNCTALTYLDLTSFTTTNVWQYSGMFRGSDHLTHILLDPTKFDTTAARRMEAMFMDCSSLQSVNVAHFNMRNVESTNNMFSGCTVLGLMQLNWDLSGIIRDEDSNANGMFVDCPLEQLYGPNGEYFFGEPF